MRILIIDRIDRTRGVPIKMSGSPVSVAEAHFACGSSKLPAISPSESFSVGDAVTLDGFQGPPLLLKLNGAKGVVVHEVDASGWMFVRLVDSDESTAKLTKVKPKHLQKIEDAPDSQVAARDDGHAIEAVLNEFVGDTAPTGPIFAEIARRSALQAGDASADNTAQEVARSIVEEVVSSAIDRVAAEPAVAEAVDEVVRAGETSETAAQSIDADEGGQAEFQIPARDSFTGDDGIEPPWYMAMCSCFGPSNWAPATNPPIEVM